VPGVSHVQRNASIVLTALKIFAYESVLQFLPETSWVDVAWLLDGEELGAKTLIKSVPALGTVARLEYQTYSTYTDTTSDIANWLLDRATFVRALLPKHHPDEARPRTEDSEDPREVFALHRSV
jgi:hypothetical protein